MTPTDEPQRSRDGKPVITAGPPARVLVVDDHAGVRKGVIGLLAMRDDFVVVGEAANGAEAVDLASELAADVVLMDLSMPAMDGVAATRRMSELADPPAVLLFTAWADRDRIAEAVAAGAAGYVLKDAPPADLFLALHAALAAPRPHLMASPVDDPGPGPSIAAVVPIRGRTAPPRRWPVRAVSGAAVVFVLGTTGVAAASQGKLPAPIQAAARFVGLPTPANHLDDARQDLARLDAALRSGDRNAIAAAADELRQRVGALSTSDQARLGAATALSNAQATLTPGASPGVAVASPPTTSNRGPGTAGATTVVTPTTTDDHGGGHGGNQGPGGGPPTTAPDDSGKGRGGGGEGSSRGGPPTTKSD